MRTMKIIGLGILGGFVAGCLAAGGTYIQASLDSDISMCGAYVVLAMMRVLIAAPLGAGVGLVLGAVCFRNKKNEYYS